MNLNEIAQMSTYVIVPPFNCIKQYLFHFILLSTFFEDWKDLDIYTIPQVLELHLPF
jgi:hypothetical protein